MMRALLLLITASVACSSAAAQPTNGSDESGVASARFEHDMLVRFHMHENFDLLRAIEKLLLRGKLDEASTLARAMAIAPDEPGMSTFAAQATRVRERAGELAAATT